MIEEEEGRSDDTSKRQDEVGASSREASANAVGIRYDCGHTQVGAVVMKAATAKVGSCVSMMYR